MDSNLIPPGPVPIIFSMDFAEEHLLSPLWMSATFTVENSAMKEDVYEKMIGGGDG